MKKNNRAALIYALSAVVLWSTVATAFKIALHEVSPVMLLLVATFSSMLLLFAIIVITSKTKIIFNQNKKKIFSFAVLGFLNPFLYYLVLFEAYNRLPAQEAQPLNYTWAIVVSVLSIIMMKQKFKLNDFVGLVVSFLGVIVIITRGSFAGIMPTDTFGAILAIGSSLIWGVFWVLSAMDDTDEIVRLFYIFLFGSVIILIYASATNGLMIPSTKGFVASVYVGVFEMGFTFVLWLYAMKSAESVSHIAGLIYFAPFISLIFIHLVLHESIAASSILGLTLIVGGVLIQHYAVKHKS